MSAIANMLLVYALICSLTDIFIHKIYNDLTFPLMLSGIIHQFSEVLFSFRWVLVETVLIPYCLAGILWLGLFVLLYQSRIIAGGDVKFLFSLYVWLGVIPYFEVFSMIIMTSGVLSLVYLIEDGRLHPFLKSGFLSLVTKPSAFKLDITYQRPIGLGLFVGTWAGLALAAA
jgi:Flp pilus assembly protein protease CpaA